MIPNHACDTAMEFKETFCAVFDIKNTGFPFLLVNGIKPEMR